MHISGSIEGFAGSILHFKPQAVISLGLSARQRISKLVFLPKTLRLR